MAATNDVVARDEVLLMRQAVQISLLVLGSVGGLMVAAVVNSTSARSSIDAARLEALTKEVDGLRLMSEQGSRPASHAAEEDDDDPDFEERKARRRGLAERYEAVITAAAAREAVDPDWASAAELQISDGVADRGPAGTKLISASCKTTLCIAEIEHPPDHERTSIVTLRHMFGTAPGLFVRHEPESGTGARTVAYLARDGYSLPPPESGESERDR